MCSTAPVACSWNAGAVAPRYRQRHGRPAACNGTFNLAGGQIVIQGVLDTAALFVRSDTVPLSIVGGTGIYQNARGNGTIQIPPDVPNQTDANFVLNADRRIAPERVLTCEDTRR